MNLHLYEYNNYYNRTIKSFSSLSEVDDFEVFIEQNTNFNPNDGITTEHIIGGPQMYSGSANYAVIEQDNEIVSRWFVLENQRTRGGQYRVVLKRDSVADYAEEVFSAPCFVEKGWVPNTDSAIYNKEDMTFNQIKKSEVLLKDKTNTPWLIGYYTKSDTALTATVPASTANPDFTVNGLANWTYYNNYITPAKLITSFDLDLYFKPSDLPTTYEANLFYSNLTYDGDITLLSSGIPDGNSSGRHYTIDTDSALWGVFGKSIDKNVLNALTKALKDNSARLFSTASSMATGYISQNEYELLTDLSGRTLFDNQTGKLYRIGYKAQTNLSTRDIIEVSLASTFGYEMYNIYSTIQTDTGGISGTRPTANNPSGRKDFGLAVSKYDDIVLTLTEIGYGNYSIDILPTAGGQTKDCPYNIFAIPFGEIDVLNNVDSPTAELTTSADIAIKIVMALISKYSGANAILHDVQLLPYCPIEELAQNITGAQQPKLMLNSIPRELWGEIKGEDDKAVGYFFNAPSSSRQFNINININISDYKIQNETEFCRLVSPNWNGIYEFSPAKNRGVSQFVVSVEYKPFSPYIHIAPQYNQNGLYGNRENDPIGLICGGDFGLTMISDAWAAYERQNKNYQNIFDRQIQSLETQKYWGFTQDLAGATIGTVQGGATGAAVGLQMGGGMGAAIGGAAGALLSAAGGAADLYINNALREENIDYTKDQFGYQLGNIRALPQSLSKVNSFNPNNTIFPILEYYGATDEEVEALRNKIKYNGMTIGRVGTLNQFINPAEETYVKGQIIKLEIPEDSHLVSDIANEIYKGVRV